eukprot:Opistho-2@26309
MQAADVLYVMPISTWRSQEMQWKPLGTGLRSTAGSAGSHWHTAGAPAILRGMLGGARPSTALNPFCLDRASKSAFVMRCLSSNEVFAWARRIDVSSAASFCDISWSAACCLPMSWLAALPMRSPLICSISAESASMRAISCFSFPSLECSESRRFNMAFSGTPSLAASFCSIHARMLKTSLWRRTTSCCNRSVLPPAATPGAEGARGWSLKFRSWVSMATTRALSASTAPAITTSIFPSENAPARNDGDFMPPEDDVAGASTSAPGDDGMFCFDVDGSSDDDPSARSSLSRVFLDIDSCATPSPICDPRRRAAVAAAASCSVRRWISSWDSRMRISKSRYIAMNGRALLSGSFFAIVR